MPISNTKEVFYITSTLQYINFSWHSCYEKCNSVESKFYMHYKANPVRLAMTLQQQQDYCYTEKYGEAAKQSTSKLYAYPK